MSLSCRRSSSGTMVSPLDSRMVICVNCKTEQRRVGATHSEQKVTGCQEACNTYCTQEAGQFAKKTRALKGFVLGVQL